MQSIIVALLLFHIGTFADLPKQVEVSVPGMVCQMCVHGMRKTFKDSVKDPKKDIMVDLDKKIVSLNLAKSLSDADIKQKVKDAGYNAVAIRRQGDEKKSM